MEDDFQFNNEPGVDLIISLWNGGSTVIEIARVTGVSVDMVKKVLFVRKCLGFLKIGG
jgi:hypothetical protein